MKPNLLVIFSDQHRWCDLGCYGNSEVRTPHLDDFSREGLQFNNAYSNCPLCVPARGTLLTGLHAIRHGAIANDLPIRPGLPSLGMALKQSGYATGYVGKWHLAGIPRDQAVPATHRLGFDYWKVHQCNHDYMHSGYHDEKGQWHDQTGYEPEAHTALALNFIQEHIDKPWGLVLSWGPPHNPYDILPKVYRNAFAANELYLRSNIPEKVFHLPGVQLDRGQIREWLAGYYAHLFALDELFGQIELFLRQTGQWERTLVVYTSDHGDLLGSQGLTQKQMPYEESAHIPLLIGGGLSSLRRGTCDELIGLVDLTPTLLGWLGVPLPGNPDGANLSGLLSDPDAKGPESLYLYNLAPCHHGAKRGDCSWRALRTKDYLYAINVDTGNEWLLFDMHHDPLQQNNLANQPEYHEIAARLHRQLCAYARHDAFVPWPELLRKYNLVEKWNISQRFFKFPELAESSPR